MVVFEGLNPVKPEARTPLGFSGHKPKNSLFSLSHFESSFGQFQIKSLGVGIFFYLKNHLRKKQLNTLVIVSHHRESLGAFGNRAGQETHFIHMS